MILVTGGTGTIGTELVRLLRDRGAAFRVFARTPAKARTLRDTGIEVVEGNLDQPQQLEAACDGVDTLFLLSPVDPRQDELQGRAIGAARRAGVPRVVRVSGAGARTGSPVSFSRWHATTDKRLEESGLAYTLLRPTWFMQNLLMSATSIAAEGRFSLPAGEAAVAAIDARDVAAVAAAVLLSPAAHENRAYELTGSAALRFEEMAEQLATATGRAVRYQAASPEQAGAVFRAAGLPDWLADGMLEMYASFRAGEGARVTGDVHKVLGRAPLAFEDFARDYANAFAPPRKA